MASYRRASQSPSSTSCQDEPGAKASVCVLPQPEYVNDLPDVADAFFTAGLVHYRYGDHAQAERCWNRCLKLNPKFAMAYYVLAQGAVVLLISDGLDRDAGEGLGAEVERLHKSCRRLVWLNPLLRYDGFEPRALGMRAILPHVDEFRAVHNLASLESLVEALGSHGARTEEGTSRWLRMAG